MSIPPTVTQVEIGGQLGNSDHREIRYNLKWEETFRSKNTSKIPDFRRVDFEELKRYLQGVDRQRMQGEVRSGTELREIRQDEKGEVRCESVGQEEGRCVRKGRRREGGGDRCEHVGRSAYAEMREASREDGRGRDEGIR